jgi:Glutamine amidotransferases class-II
MTGGASNRRRNHVWFFPCRAASEADQATKGDLEGQFMSAHRILSRNLACLVVACISLILFSDPAGACRLSAVVGNNLPDNLLQSHLISAPNSLEQLSHSQLDGWGIGYYPQYGDDPIIERGAIRAYNDPSYGTTVAGVNLSKPKITIAHIRTCATGCCSHGTDTVTDPHPFYRVKNGKTWIFVHNGVVEKDRMTILLGDYLTANPPNGSGIPACDPSNPDLVVDTELYFLFVLKKIEENGWNAVGGISKAIKAMVDAGETGAMNFIMSDGEMTWAFRRGDSFHTLYYLDGSADPLNGYTAVASQYPTSTQGSWVTITNDQLIVLAPGASPLGISDAMNYCPGDINEDGQVNAADLTVFAENFGLSGDGDLDFDGDVDGADLAALAGSYGKACP